MTEILKAYKFRIYPNSEQAIKLAQTFGCVRVVWNNLVANFNAYGTPDFKTKFSEKEIKENKDLSFLKEVSAASLQQVRMNFDETKKQYFSKTRKVKIGRMQFKKRGNKQSYRLPNQKFKLLQDEGLIQLEKIGKIKVIIDRKLGEVDYRSVTISKTPTGEFFVSVLVKEIINHFPLTNRVVGIDVGLKDLFILSNKDVIKNPRWYRENQARLARAQKHLSRKQRGSYRYDKQRIKVARIYEDISNKRNYFIHNITKKLVEKFDVISVENLSVKNMIKNRKLSKSIQDASWSEFIRQLDYKCNWYGKTFIKIDRFYPSSKTCSSCGYKLETLDLSIREWNCPDCGTHLDRDFNAATNILVKGYSDLTGLSLEDSSAELVDYRRGEDVRLLDVNHHLATSMKRLDDSIIL